MKWPEAISCPIVLQVKSETNTNIFTLSNLKMLFIAIHEKLNKGWILETRRQKRWKKHVIFKKY